MSSVHDVILAFGLLEGGSTQADRLLRTINDLHSREVDLVALQRDKPPRLWASHVAVGSMKGARVEQWVRNIVESIDFAAYGCTWAQMIVRTDQDQGFSIIDLHRSYGLPFDAKSIEERIFGASPL